MTKIIEVVFEMTNGKFETFTTLMQPVNIRVFVDRFEIDIGEGTGTQILLRSEVKEIKFANLNAPEECFKDGTYDPDLGTDTIDCDNLERTEEA